MADWGIAVKKAYINGSTVNKNVTDCADYELAYSSKFVVPKQFAAQPSTITLTGTDPANPATVAISHNLGYVPMFEVFCEISPGDGFLTPLTAYFDTSGSGINFTAYATTTDLVIQQSNFNISPTGFGVYNFFYYIFYDDAGSI